MNAGAPTTDLDKYGSQPSPFDKLRAGSAGLNSGTLFCTRYSCVYVKSGERLLPKTPKTPKLKASPQAWGGWVTGKTVAEQAERCWAHRSSGPASRLPFAGGTERCPARIR
jgi:hypothetical protein